MKRLITAALATASVAVALLVAPTDAFAAQRSVNPPSAGQMPSEVPSAITPQVTGDNILGIASVGSRIIIGGPFTQVGGSARTGIAALDATTGALSTTFNPKVTGSVLMVLPGPVADTVYVAGKFTAINGTATKNVALLNTTNGAIVSSFKPPAITGEIDDIDRVGNRLYLGGNITKVGNTALSGLATLNATTGAADPFLQVKLTVRHNDGVPGDIATSAVGATNIAASPDGTKLVVIGNFRKADTYDRVQAAIIDLTGTTAKVKADWATTGYVPPCHNDAYDTYMRGLAFAPDGSYFVITATGGGNGTLCDAAARWETNAIGADVQPTWVNQAGGDTFWSTTVTSSAVFVGGHQRWANNPNGNDFAGGGAVPRPGLVALDPVSGRPLTWNPGRNPRGISVKSMLATDKGLWIGHDTDWIGNRKYQRQRLAFFPYAGGYTLPATTTATLPAQVFVGHGDQGQATNVLYRVNAGGAAIASNDSGPDWSDDSGTNSELRNTGSNAADWGSGAQVGPTVPAGVPGAIFDSERWDPNDSNEMQWHLPVAAGTPIEVRVYLTNRCGCTSSPGQRVFNVDLDGNRVLNNYDIVADAGDNNGLMKAFDITSDGSVDLVFGHLTENPLVNGIEIIRTDLNPGPSLGLTKSTFDGSTATTPVAVGSSIDWATVRGGFAVGQQLFFGKSDRTFWRASFDGETIGTPVQIDPYHDPKWKDVPYGYGPETYDGATPAFYNQLTSVGGTFYANGRIYYNQVGSSALRWIWFSPDSGIVDGVSFTATSSVSFANTSGMFVAGGQLYFVDRSTGNLNKVAFSGGVVSGAASLVSGPANGGPDWRGRALFAGNPPPNSLPTASFTSMCTNLDCGFDGSASADSDGTVVSDAWTFGDGQTATGATPNHTYAAGGSYQVTLTVTDNRGATGSVTKTVAPVAPVAGSGFVGAAHTTDAKSVTKVVTPAPGTQAGDLMLLTYVGNTDVPSVPAGWTLRSSTSNGTAYNTTVWSKIAAAGDVGQAVTMTQLASAKAIASIASYRGFTTVASATAALDSGVAMHGTPATTTASGDLVVSLWSDKSATTTDWTPPANLTQRDESIGSGAGHVSVMLADSGARQSAGTYPTQVATTDAPSTKGLSFSIVLRP